MAIDINIEMEIEIDRLIDSPLLLRAQNILRQGRPLCGNFRTSVAVWQTHGPSRSRLRRSDLAAMSQVGLVDWVPRDVRSGTSSDSDFGTLLLLAKREAATGGNAGFQRWTFQLEAYHPEAKKAWRPKLPLGSTSNSPSMSSSCEMLDAQRMNKFCTKDFEPTGQEDQLTDCLSDCVACSTRNAVKLSRSLVPEPEASNSMNVLRMLIPLTPVADEGSLRPAGVTGMAADS